MVLHRFSRTLFLGLRSLALHKLRSTLTALGIIFGVSSVIAMRCSEFSRNSEEFQAT